jgi:starch phosphorylase
MYEPVASRGEALSGSRYARARELAAWKKRVVAVWPDVKVVDVESDTDQRMVDLGAERHVTVEVRLGSLTTDDVAVELLHGPVSGGGELTETRVVRLELVGPPPADSGSSTSDSILYRGSFRCDDAGRHGYTVRVVPSHPDLAVSVEMGCIAWA